MGKKKNVHINDDYSSDEEELFSYLTKVEKCKPPEPVHHSALENQNVINVDENEAEKINKEEPGTNNSCSKLQVNEEIDIVKPVPQNEICVDEYEEKNEEDPNTNKSCSKLQRDEDVFNVKLIDNPEICPVKNSNSIAQQVESNEVLDSKIPLECKVEELEEVSSKVNAEKVETSLQTKDTGDVDVKQNSESSSKTDRYYLINEKDWLTLCAKLDNAENVGSIERRMETVIKDSSEEILVQDSSKSNSEDKKSPNGKGKSLSSAFKHYNPISKTLLKETVSSQTTSNTSPEKQKVSASTKTKKQITKPTEQLVSQDENEWSDSKISKASDSKASPNVEIVYISLEDGNIRYDINNSPIKNTGYANPNVMKELDFCQQISVPVTDSQRPIRVPTTVPDNNECIDLVNDDQDAYKTNFSFGNSNTVFNNSLNTRTPTGHNTQVRFVRIDNKLTRVYENVKHNETDEVVDAYVHNQNDQYSQSKEELNVHDAIDGNVTDNDSFNFNDSQLVAFPLNAFDVENINKDDSMSQLTPSKLDILNTSCNMDPLTPGKLQMHSQGDIYHLPPNKFKRYSPSKSGLSSPYKLNITLKNKVHEPESSAKIQESCPELHDKLNVRKRRQLDSENKRKIKNVKIGNRKNGNEMIEETNVARAGTEYYVYPNGVITPKINKDSGVFCMESNYQSRRKRKCYTQMTSCHKNCNYKQVDFKDFKNESREVIHKRKSCEDTKSDETLKEAVVNNTSNLKENQKNISRIKDDKKPLKKRKVTTYEIKENSEFIKDEEGESLEGVNKACLIKEAKPVKNKSKITSEKENGTKEKETQEKAELLNMTYRQEKIDFLENMFHVKLKEASVEYSAEESKVFESQSKLNNTSALCEKSVNKFEIFPDEKTSKRRKIGGRVKKEAAVKGNKNKIDGASATVPNNDNKQLSESNKLDNSSQCRRKRNKNTDHIEKLEQNTCIDESRSQSDLNEYCNGGKESRPHTIIKSLGGLNVRVKRRKQDGQNLDQESIPVCNVKSKSKSQRQRTACTKKKSEVLSTKDGSKTEELSQSKSGNSWNAVASRNTRTRGKRKCLKNGKSGRVNNVTHKESGEENVLLENETENGDHSDAQKNEKGNEGEEQNDSKNKRAPGKLKSKKIVKCKNIELNSSSDMDALDTNVKNEQCDSQTVVVETPGSALLNSNDKYIDSDGKKPGTIISILATFQPLQGEESQSDEITETVEAGNKDDSQDKISETKADEETHNVKKSKVLSKGRDKRMPKRKEKIANDTSKTKANNIKVPKDLSSSEETLRKKACSENEKNKTTSPKMVRTGKANVNNSGEKGFAAKSLKSTKRPYTRRKLKCASKRHGKESWKELLDESAFNLDINDVTTEKHKPVNVRRMIRNILKTSQGKEKCDDEHNRHREKKEKSHREKKEETCKDHTCGSSSQVFTLESDDAWMSDSSQSSSFPAFQFTSGSDSETGKQVSKVLRNDNIVENTSKLDTDSIKDVTDLQNSAQNYIELHHSPVRLTKTKDDTFVNNSSESETKPTDSTEAVIGTKGSPEIKKNVDKLIAILDKVSEKKAVRNLEFLDNASRQ